MVLLELPLNLTRFRPWRIERLGEGLELTCRVPDPKLRLDRLTFALSQLDSRTYRHPQVSGRSRVSTQVYPALAILGTAGALEHGLPNSEGSAEAAYVAPSPAGPRSPASSPFFNPSGGIQ